VQVEARHLDVRPVDQIDPHPPMLASGRSARWLKPTAAGMNLENLGSRADSSATVVVGSAVVVAVLRGLLAMSAGFRSALVQTAKPDRGRILRNDSNSEMDGWIRLRELAIPEAYEGFDSASEQVYTTPPVPKRGAGTTVDVVCRGVTAAAFALRPAPRRAQASAPASY